ncbi:unnamed protein product [Cylindrotheca closterium]|uniref:Uncharacterized protein n=1 Tax=Cylindrotheca closterium TaxID=2856 RepID=A0AAD2FR03_9STRA|nr:unnamed protein product [Cylindrotheca closterium]
MPRESPREYAEVFANLLTIQKEAQGDLDTDTADTYEELAAAYSLQGMPELAIEACGKAINIRKSMLGNDYIHPLTKNLMMTTLKGFKREKTAKALNEQGLAMSAQGDSDMASDTTLP